MKTLLIYDSVFGNTKAIAEIIFKNLATEKKRLLHVDEAVKNGDIEAELIIIGSPTRQFKATPKIMGFIKQLPFQSVKTLKFACFDTRVDTEDINGSFLRFMVNTGGYAVKKMEKALKKRGARPLLDGAGFFVEGQEGPLKAQEEERAVAWVTSINQLA